MIQRPAVWPLVCHVENVAQVVDVRREERRAGGRRAGTRKAGKRAQGAPPAPGVRKSKSRRRQDGGVRPGEDLSGGLRLYEGDPWAPECDADYRRRSRCRPARMRAGTVKYEYEEKYDDDAHA